MFRIDDKIIKNITGNLFPNVVVRGRVLCDLEVLLSGGFKPLTGFLNKLDYISVVENMRLISGEIWPIPIVYPIKKSELNLYKTNKKINLVDDTNAIKVEDLSFKYFGSSYC